MEAIMIFFLSFCLAGAKALVCIDDEEEVVQVKAQQVISITETLALNEDIMWKKFAIEAVVNLGLIQTLFSAL